MKKALIIFCAFFALSANTVSYQVTDTNAKIKAVFLYNFTKYIEWPKNYKEGRFVFSIWGNNPSLLIELTRMASVKTIGTQKIDIQNITSIENLDKCHVLYVLPENSSHFNLALAKLKGKSTLIVTEKPGLAKMGAAINFVIVDNKQKFELNRANAEKHSLKISSSLSSLAIPVE